MTSSGVAPFPWGKHFMRIGLTIVVFIVLPLTPAIWAAIQASAHGCQLHEGSPNPCLIDGVDQGDLLYSLFLTSWLAAIVGAIGIFLIIAWIAILYREMGRWGRS